MDYKLKVKKYKTQKEIMRDSQNNIQYNHTHIIQQGLNLHSIHILEE